MITVKQVKDWYKSEFERMSLVETPCLPEFFVRRSALCAWLRSQIEEGHEIEGLRVRKGKLPSAPDLWEWESSIGLTKLAERLVKAEERRRKRERERAQNAFFEELDATTKEARQ